MENDHGRLIASICATCRRCGYSTIAFGTHAASVLCALAMLREGCPRDEDNFYQEGIGGDDDDDEDGAVDDE